MSVREYSWYNPVPWISGGGPIALRVLAQLKTRDVASPGVNQNTV